jgi:hypothetical protein
MFEALTHLLPLLGERPTGTVLCWLLDEPARSRVMKAALEITDSPLVTFGILDAFGGALPATWVHAAADACFFQAGLTYESEFVAALLKQTATMHGAIATASAAVADEMRERLERLDDVEYVVVSE